MQPTRLPPAASQLPLNRGAGTPHCSGYKAKGNPPTSLQNTSLEFRDRLTFSWQQRERNLLRTIQFEGATEETATPPKRESFVLPSPLLLVSGIETNHTGRQFLYNRES